MKSPAITDRAPVATPSCHDGLSPLKRRVQITVSALLFLVRHLIRMLRDLTNTEPKAVNLFSHCSVTIVLNDIIPLKNISKERSKGQGERERAGKSLSQVAGVVSGPLWNATCLFSMSFMVPHALLHLRQ